MREVILRKFDEPDDVRTFEKGKFELVHIGGITIGRATYDAAQEARNEDLTRDEAVDLVRRFDGEFPSRFVKECFEYLSIPEKGFPVASRMFEQPTMTPEYFSMLTDHFRSPHLWQRRGNEWKLRHAVWKDPAD